VHLVFEVDVDVLRVFSIVAKQLQTRFHFHIFKGGVFLNCMNYLKVHL
jgi:hypothetical protein